MFNSVNCLEMIDHSSPSSKMKSTSKLHEVLFNAFPISWVITKSDHHYWDYDIEILDRHTPKGVHFSLIISHDPSQSLNMTTDALKWYMDEADKPVILVNINIKDGTSSWLLLQDYIQGILEVKNTHWRTMQQITLEIPKHHLLPASMNKFISSVYYGCELLYIKQFYNYFNNIHKHISEFLNSPAEIKRAIDLEAARSSLGQSCTSCNSNDPLTELIQEADQKIQSSLEQAQGMKVLDPKDNRTAYYCISAAMDLYGSRASAEIRYTALGEMSFYDYLLNFMKTFESLTPRTNLLAVAPVEHKRYFSAIQDLTNLIIGSINEGQIIAASMLTIRLADTYLFALPYLMSCLDQPMTAPLMEYAQSLLMLAHEMASLMEYPQNLLQ
ncbi:hypothetical protein [Desulfotomaculum sp. 1211_IL3151]|uniref:hypothetical protein n=1 Tax=Desulfotomaculum sp. 1211_IL3151 TaxID=3084055 RepID=UPI002FD8D283